MLLKRANCLISELNVKYSPVFYFAISIEYLLPSRIPWSSLGEKADEDDRLSQACRGMRRDLADRTHLRPAHHAAAHCGNLDESRQRCRSQCAGRLGEKSAGGFELELIAWWF